MDVLRYEYRRLFHLTALELEAEPLDQFFTNLYIYGQMKQKEAKEQQHGTN